MIVNGTPIRVTLADGKSENVQLSRLTVRQLYTWAKLVREHDMPNLVALCTGKPIEWIDTLSDESFGELAKACFDANFPRAMTLMKSDPVIAVDLGPLLGETVALAEKMGMLGGLSSGSLPAPAPSESAPATGSESSISPPSASSPSSENIAA
jgi:hypothetical protein